MNNFPKFVYIENMGRNYEQNVQTRFSTGTEGLSERQERSPRRHRHFLDNGHDGAVPRLNA